MLRERLPFPVSTLHRDVKQITRYDALVNLKLHDALLRLWDKAVDHPNYNKREWAELQARILELEGRLHILRLTLAYSMGVSYDEEDDSGNGVEES